MSQITELRWFFFPYCIDQQSDGSWLLLNRAYKPVGTTSNESVDYQSHPSRVPIKITKAVAKKLSYEPIGDEVPSRIYFYDDGTVPTASKANMDSYLAKLAVLASIELRLP